MATKSLGALIGHLHRAALLPDRAGRTDSQLLEYFVSRRDEAAFEALVRRHGPMVFAVCRRVIGNLHDAEDAFQASFLVLARKAASVSPREAVGNWLYGVAYRTARRARAVSARQRAREKQVKDMPHPSTEPADPLQELGPLLDQELSRLPDKYRLPLVLCELEGRPRKEVARQLKLPEGTLSSRLATGRKMLASRLARHGLASSGAMLAALLPQGSASASVPSSLVTSTAKAASLFAAGQAAAAVVSTEVAALVEEVLKTMLLIKLKIGAGLLLSLAALVIGAYGLTSPSLQADPAVVKEPLQVKTEQPPAAVEQGRVQGRFTAADTGKPVAGAEVRVLVQGVSGKAAVVEALSDADGRYTAKVPFGHCRLWGVHSPAGYYTQAPMTYGTIVTTRAEPQMVRDFVLQPGSPWQVDLHGASLPSDKPPLFSAVRDPERQMFSTGETITVTGDARGKAVLTIPAAGGSYRFRCGLMDSSAHYEIPPVNLEIDKGFDPRQIKGVPEPQAQRKAVRLRDTAGRSAVVEGGEVLVEAGRAVLRFHAQRIPTVSALVFRGSAVDEAGKPVKGAKFTAAFATGRGGAMSEWKTMTDARGKMEMADVMLPQSFFEPDGRVRMMVVKPGYDGAQTEELNLLEVKRAGSGDFGTVVLRPGRTLRGKVVDENGRPLQGAIVINMTNYFLYGHLQCRTDAEGRFIMPDLSWGRQQVTAQYGERSGREVFQFDANKGEHLITVRLTPQSGSRQSQSVSRQSSRARPPLPPAPREGVWDLTPPIKEPKYQNEPRYALVVFGPKRDHRVWMVLDGTTLYVDRNGNGDLTEPDERLEPNNPKDGSNHFGGSGSHTHFDVFEFTVRAGIGGTGKFKLHHWIRAENFVPKTDFDRQLHAKWLELRYENSTLWRQDGQGQGQTPVVFMPKPADAQVCALDGPLTFVLKLGENQVLKRGEAGCDLAFHIAVMGRPHRGAEQQFYNPLATTEVPEGAHLVADIEYSSKAANTPPLHRKYLLKQRC